MARKPTPREEQRTKRLGIPVTEREHAVIESEARLADMTVADMTRRIIMDSLHRRATVRSRAHSRAHLAALRQARPEDFELRNEMRARSYLKPARGEFPAGSSVSSEGGLWPAAQPAIDPAPFAGAEMRSVSDHLEPAAATTPAPITAEDRAAFRHDNPSWAGLPDEQLDLLIEDRRKRGAQS